MRKTTLHAWITMLFCALAVLTEVIDPASLQLPF
jgi:hypothetical protein